MTKYSCEQKARVHRRKTHRKRLPWLTAKLFSCYTKKHSASTPVPILGTKKVCFDIRKILTSRAISYIIKQRSFPDLRKLLLSFILFSYFTAAKKGVTFFAIKENIPPTPAVTATSTAGTITLAIFITPVLNS